MSPQSPFFGRRDYEDTSVVLILPRNTHTNTSGYFSAVDIHWQGLKEQVTQIYVHITVLVKSSHDIHCLTMPIPTHYKQEGWRRTRKLLEFHRVWSWLSLAARNWPQDLWYSLLLQGLNNAHYSSSNPSKHQWRYVGKMVGKLSDICTQILEINGAG